MEPPPPIKTPLIPLKQGIYAKDETKQITSAFKYRGTYTRICSSPGNGPLVAASTGNHAAATATVGREMGRPVHVFVPANTPLVKTRRIIDAGGEVHIVEGDYQNCYQAASSFAKVVHGELIESFDNIVTIAGHTSLFAEVLADLTTPPARIYVPVGGGGLLASAILFFLGTRTEVVGVEFAGAAGMRESLLARRVVHVQIPVAVPAEGLLVQRIGQIPFVIASNLDRIRIIEVSEGQLRAEVAKLWWTSGIKAELAGAAALAGYAIDDPTEGLSVAVVSGGNIDLALHEQIIDEHGQVAA